MLIERLMGNPKKTNVVILRPGHAESTSAPKTAGP